MSGGKCRAHCTRKSSETRTSDSDQRPRRQIQMRRTSWSSHFCKLEMRERSTICYSYSSQDAYSSTQDTTPHSRFALHCSRLYTRSDHDATFGTTTKNSTFHENSQTTKSASSKNRSTAIRVLTGKSQHPPLTVHHSHPPVYHPLFPTISRPFPLPSVVVPSRRHCPYSTDLMNLLAKMCFRRLSLAVLSHAQGNYNVSRHSATIYVKFLQRRC